jgi:hypothetical protein
MDKFLFLKKWPFPSRGDRFAEPRPYRDWRLMLISFFILLLGVFVGHYSLSRELIFLGESAASGPSNNNQLIHTENLLKTTVGDIQKKNLNLDNLLKPATKRLDPSR